MSTPWHVYDVITGLAGTGRVLLAAHQSGHAAAEPGLLAALTTLTNHRAGSRRPGWWLPADRHPAAVTAHPSGAATTGMAHGIAGPLALLATAPPGRIHRPRPTRRHHPRRCLAAALARRTHQDMGPAHHRRRPRCRPRRPASRTRRRLVLRHSRHQPRAHTRRPGRQRTRGRGGRPGRAAPPRGTAGPLGRRRTDALPRIRRRPPRRRHHPQHGRREARRDRGHRRVRPHAPLRFRTRRREHGHRPARLPHRRRRNGARSRRARHVPRPRGPAHGLGRPAAVLTPSVS